MNQTGVDYSKFPFRISEIPTVEWEGLGFAIAFKTEQDPDTQTNIEELITSWYTEGEESANGPSFISEYEWDGGKKLKFWVDMGQSESTFLEELLNLLADEVESISEITLGK